MMTMPTNHFDASSSCPILLFAAVLLFVATCPTVVFSEVYTFDYVPPPQDDFPFTTSSTVLGGSQRILQTGQTTCDPVGARFKCTTSTTLSESNDNDPNNKTGAYTVLTVYTECDLDSQNLFNFRKAHHCDCEAHVHRVRADGTSPMDKYCPCIVCTDGFGNNPVSIDCSPWDAVNAAANNGTNTTTNRRHLQQSTGSATNTTTANSTYPDSIIINTCSSLDCGLGCNGTCRIDCAYSDASCNFCKNNPNNTIPPTNPGGSGSAAAQPNSDDPLTNYDGKPRYSLAPYDYNRVMMAGTSLIGVILLI